jgi:hypothetical protein
MNNKDGLSSQRMNKGSGMNTVEMNNPATSGGVLNPKLRNKNLFEFAGSFEPLRQVLLFPL